MTSDLACQRAAILDDGEEQGVSVGGRTAAAMIKPPDHRDRT